MEEIVEDVASRIRYGEKATLVLYNTKYIKQRTRIVIRYRIVIIDEINKRNS